LLSCFVQANAQTLLMLQKDQPKVLNAWAMYDWANSVYNLVITSTIFPLYYSLSTKNAFGVAETVGEEEVVRVPFFGVSLDSMALYSYGISFSFLLVALLSPLLSGVADYGGKKKIMMKLFTYLGAGACVLLYFFEGSNVELGIVAAATASVGYAGGVLFYNSYLPDIASEKMMDRTSAKGFAFGYVGSVLLQIVNLMMVMKYEWFGLENELAGMRLAFVTVGLWWAGFAQYTFYHLPGNVYARKAQGSLLAQGLRELRSVWRVVRGAKHIRTFLLAFFFYNMGVQTVMLMATPFGEKTLKLPSSSLIATILLLQLIGIVGAFGFAYFSKKVGNKAAILTMLVIWLVVCVSAYFVYTEKQFYALAALVGLVMGGTQSLSRSTYSKLVPEDTQDTASFFSFYDICEKISIVLGMASFGLIVQFTGSMRNSTFALTLFFVLGIIVLSQLRRKW